MPLCLLIEFYHQALAWPWGKQSEVMVNSVSSSDPRQNAQQAQEIQRQKQEDQARHVRNNQKPSPPNVQRPTDHDHDQDDVRAEKQNSQQAKGASLDVRA